MELRRAAETVLRTQQASPFLLSHNGISLRKSQCSSWIRRCRFQPSSCARTFTSTPRRPDQEADAAQRQYANRGANNDSVPQRAPPTQQQPSKSTAQIHSEMMRRLQPEDTPRQQRPTFRHLEPMGQNNMLFPGTRDGSTRNSTENSQSPNRPQHQQGGTASRQSLLDFTKLRAPTMPPASMFGRRDAGTMANAVQRAAPDYSEAASSGGGAGGRPSTRNIPGPAYANNLDTAEPPPAVQTGPQAGRTVALRPQAGVDLERAMRKLDMVVAGNRIRHDFNSQRFHERKGLRRKRLKSERWRRRFRVGFDHMCKRVTELKRQGW